MKSLSLVIPIEDIKLWGDLAFKDLPSIENTLHNLETGRYSVFTFQTKDILNKAIDVLNCAYTENLISEEDRETGTNIIKTSIITKEITSEHTEYILGILYNYNEFLDRRLSIVDEDINDLLNSGWKRIDELEIRADFISESIESFQSNLFANKENLVKNHIFNSKTGKYITEIANELSERFGEGFTVSNVKKIIDRLEENKTITTWGGWGTGKRNRICYPNFRVIDRSLFDGTEQKLEGIVEKRITKMFEPQSATSFGWEMYEFDSEYEEPVYVVAGASFKDGTELDTIGLFSHANLKEQMNTRFGYVLKPEYNSYSDKDSLIAYIVKYPDDNKVLWYNKEVPRALDFIGRNQEIIWHAA